LAQEFHFRRKERGVFVLAVWSWVPSLLNWVLLLLSLFLILLVLIQRGKGGGLAGAFGGAGGSSAFGSRAGDLFTKITIGVAAGWIILTMIQVKAVYSDASQRGSGNYDYFSSTPSESQP
jgi:preprotein translocase subunit SecG